MYRVRTSPIDQRTSDRWVYGSRKGWPRRGTSAVPIVALLVLGSTFGTTQAARASPVGYSIACGSSIGTTQQPTAAGYRIVLGTVSVPPSYNPQVVPVRGRWPYWRKAGMAVRAGNAAAVVSVPLRWRSQVAITWGNSPVANALNFSGCGLSTGPANRSTTSHSLPTHTWRGYAGGFYLRASKACVPLIFAVGNRRATVYFGIGKHCRNT